MSEQLFILPEKSSSTLQKQIQEMLVKAILDGHIPINEPLPSGRKLASQLGVARNTVVFAYQQLVDEGFLIPKERSGHFVNPSILEGHITQIPEPSKVTSKNAVRWRRLTHRPSDLSSCRKPEDWQSYPYPFLYGQYDKTLFPVADWRECCREAASLSAIHYWASDQIENDDAELLEQIHTRLLPRRGIWANPNEILITVGAQNAIFLAASLLLRHNKTGGVENPGYYDAINTFRYITDNVVPLPVDGEGLIPGVQMSTCDCVYVTPSHHFPTTVAMPQSRRVELLKLARQHDFILIEDDYESELSYEGQPTPALKSLDKDGRVVYISSLSKTLAPGIRLGYMVAHADFIREARALRRMMLRHTPSNNQFIIAQFIKRGYHDAAVRRLSMAMKERWQVMSDALKKYMPEANVRLTPSGSAFWIVGPEKLNVGELAQAALAQGILIEPGDVFYYQEHAPQNHYRLGFSSIPTESIAQGISILAEIQQSLLN